MNKTKVFIYLVVLVLVNVYLTV